MTHREDPRANNLDRFRGYLRLVARLQAGPSLQAKLDASDIVQQTLVRALVGLPQLQATDDAQTAAWLREILSRQIATAARDLGRQKRDVSRERSLDQSASRLEAFLTAQGPSPSQHAARKEQVVLLANALEALPDAQREAIIAHHLEGMSLAEVGVRLERSSVAVAGLIKRGLRNLRQQMSDGE